MRQGRDGLRVHLIYLEKLLAARDWLAGARLSLGDFAAAATSRSWIISATFPGATFPAVRPGTCASSPAPPSGALADRWPGLAPSSSYDDLDF